MPLKARWILDCLSTSAFSVFIHTGFGIKTFVCVFRVVRKDLRLSLCTFNCRQLHTLLLDLLLMHNQFNWNLTLVKVRIDQPELHSEHDSYAFHHCELWINIRRYELSSHSPAPLCCLPFVALLQFCCCGLCQDAMFGLIKTSINILDTEQ